MPNIPPIPAMMGEFAGPLCVGGLIHRDLKPGSGSIDAGCAFLIPQRGQLRDLHRLEPRNGSAWGAAGEVLTLFGREQDATAALMVPMSDGCGSVIGTKKDTSPLTFPSRSAARVSVGDSLVTQLVRSRQYGSSIGTQEGLQVRF